MADNSEEKETSSNGEDSEERINVFKNETDEDFEISRTINNYNWKSKKYFEKEKKIVFLQCNLLIYCYSFSLPCLKRVM